MSTCRGRRAPGAALFWLVWVCATRSSIEPLGRAARTLRPHRRAGGHGRLRRARSTGSRATPRRRDGHVPDTLLPRLLAARGFADADDIAAVLHYRVVNATGQRPTGSARRRQAPRLIAWLIPHASGHMSDDMRRALDERRHLIEQRARALAETALADDEPGPATSATRLATSDGEQSGCAILRRWPPIAIATTSAPTPRPAHHRSTRPSVSMRHAPAPPWLTRNGSEKQTSPTAVLVRPRPTGTVPRSDPVSDGRPPIERQSVS